MADRFRWTFCQIEALRDCYKPPELRRALENLPETLDKSHALILESIPKHNIKDETTILRLLT